jgi:energy-coupling factor transport system ATP-binding protein
MPGIEISRLSFSYSKTPVLKNISLAFPPGGFYGITGINGSGKSTLLYCLNGLIPHELRGQFSGEVLIDHISTLSKPVSFWAHIIGFVFQNPDFSLFNLTVAEEIGFNNSSADIASVLKQVNLAGLAQRDPQTLSFGQKQKVCLAGALAKKTPFLVLDEPTAMLDYKNSVELYRLLKKLQDRGKTIIVVEHNTRFLLDYADRAVILDQGKVLSDGKPKAVFSQTKLLQSLGIQIPGL